MELILATANGIDERVIDCEFDIEIGGENTFELTLPYALYSNDLTFRKRVYIAKTEFGGIINAISGDTSKDTVFVSGYTWRGILNKRIVAPSSTFSGDLNGIISALVPADGTFAVVPGIAGQSATITVSEYTTVEKVISDACQSVGYRLNISYVNNKVMLSAVPATNVSYVSQDDPLDFESKDDRMGINHLRCVGKNETIHLYADDYGNVSQRQSLFGIDEYTDVFETTADTRSKLIDEGTKELKNRANYKTLTAYLITTEDVNIGDFVTGRDYITGITLTKPVTKKIITYRDGDLTISNKIEGEA